MTINSLKLLQQIKTTDELLTPELLKTCVNYASDTLNQRKVGLFNFIPKSDLLMNLIKISKDIITRSTESMDQPLKKADAIELAKILANFFETFGSERNNSTYDIDLLLAQKLRATLTLQKKVSEAIDTMRLEDLAMIAVCCNVM